MATWGYRVVKFDDVEDAVYGVHEVYYDEQHMPTGMSAPVLISSDRNFRDVLQQVAEGIRRPVHDPENPVKAPRSYRVDELGSIPGTEEAKAIPLTLPEIISYHRNAATDLAEAIETQGAELHPQMVEVAKMDREMCVRIARTLNDIPDLDAIRTKLYGYIGDARVMAQAYPPSNPDDMAKDLDELDGLLENIQGLLARIGNPPGPDGCQVCKGARGGMPGNENVVDGVVMCDECSVAADFAKRRKPEGANCWVPQK